MLTSYARQQIKYTHLEYRRKTHQCRSTCATSMSVSIIESQLRNIAQSHRSSGKCGEEVGGVQLLRLAMNYWCAVTSSGTVIVH